jgi:putative tryptophan/tyrosine transport system substrate-binding protein
MQRRDFITLLGGSAAVWPLAARAQQDGRVRRIGFLSTGARTDASGQQQRLGAFRRGLAELGWTEGRNLVIEERWAEDDAGHLRASAAELVGLRPEAIFVANSATLAAIRRATGTIPIVFGAVGDPVG